MSHHDSANTSRICAFLKFPILLLLCLYTGETAATVRAQTNEKIVATVNGKGITQDEVDSSITSQLFPLQQQIAAIRKIALENLILRTILENEAKKKGISVEELRKQLTAGKVEVPSSQAEEIYLENATTFAAMSRDEAIERIRLDLETQARMRNYRDALLKLKESSRVQNLLDEPTLPSGALGANSPSIGATAAAITITEFSDFQCPYCKEVQSALKQVRQTYGNNVRLIFKHLPLKIHPQAFASAQAAFCAGEQGSFWQYHDALFASENLSPEIFVQTATRLGLNPAEFKACSESETSRAAVLEDVQEARRLGIDGTPAFIINGKLVSGALSFAEFKTIIERELKSTQLTSLKQ